MIRGWPALGTGHCPQPFSANVCVNLFGSSKPLFPPRPISSRIDLPDRLLLSQLVDLVIYSVYVGRRNVVLSPQLSVLFVERSALVRGSC